MALTNDPLLDTPIRSEGDLLDVFRGAEKPESEFRIGPEMEKPGVDAKTFAPIPYERQKNQKNEQSVLAVLEHLVTTHGWIPDRETEDGPIIALLRGRASVTLEPGGQLELSGAAMEDVHQVCAEFRGHLREIAPISKELGIRWLGLGFHPFARREELPWVPKIRYGVMRDYLPTRGAHALDMMLRTSTVQANYDFSSEEDAMRKMRVSLKLSPLTTALFANSPWLEGKPFGGVTYRGRVWLDVDPDRSGLLESLWSDKASYKDYVEWALDVPMFLIKRRAEVFKNTGQTFRAFMKDGFEGHKPTHNDWQTHLNTVFPEVRLKKTIEIRGADAASSKVACALPALYTGIFYDAKALAEAEALVQDWTFAEVSDSRLDFATNGLRASFRGKPVREFAEKLVTIAEGGLARRNRKSARGNDETVHLAPLKPMVEQAKTAADFLLESIDPKGDFKAQVVEKTDLLASLDG